ncbi:MAG: hypothetical protein AAFQ65_04025 [Myxococcota bacterium]
MRSACNFHPMPSLQIRDLPDELYEQLRVEAKREHRSLAQQATALLEKQLQGGSGSRSRRVALLERIATRDRASRGDLPAPEDLLAADRAR